MQIEPSTRLYDDLHTPSRYLSEDGGGGEAWGDTTTTITRDGDSGSEAGADGEQVGEQDGELELLALFLQGGRRLGCARYLAHTCRVEVFEVSVLVSMEGSGGRGGSGPAADAQTIPMLTEQDIPSSLLWLVQYIRARDPLLFVPDSGAGPLEELAALLHAKCTRLQTRTAFDPAAALPRLCAMYPQLTPAEAAGRFDLAKEAMLAAMAALLFYTASARCNVCDVVERAPRGVMYVERLAAQWLQLTRTEQHPCGFQGIGRAKEGLSLLSAVGYAVTAHGRALLRQWFQLPSSDREEIEQRQRVVGFFADARRRDALRQLRRVMPHIRPTNALFTAMRSGRAVLGHFRSLLRTIKGLLAVYDIVQPMEEELPALRDLVAATDAPRLRFLAREMEARVYRIREPAAGQRRGGGGLRGAAPVLRPTAGPAGPDDVAWVTYVDSGGLSAGRVSFSVGIDAPLDELRLLHTRLGGLLAARAEEALEELAPPLRYGLSIQCLYAAPHGYLLLVDGSRCGGPEDTSASAAAAAAAAVAQLLVEQHGWRLQFTLPMGTAREPGGAVVAGTTLYAFKNAAMLTLDAEVGSLLQRVRSREDALRRELETVLLRESLCLLQPVQAIAELDCLLGFAHCAVQRHWCCPRMSPDPAALDIEDGWHPVLHQTLSAAGAAGRGAPGAAVTSFCFRAKTPRGHVSVATGPGGSGKTTLLTAVAQLVFLAHLGSFVPAAAATVGLTGYLLACYGVTDGGGLSSFESECLALNRVLRHCAGEVAGDGGGSDGAGGVLVLIDDFGRGTAPADAAALLGAALRFFATGQSTTTSPIVLCATHFTELFLPPVADTAAARERLAFPFDKVTVYVMTCTPVYEEDGGTSDAGMDDMARPRDRHHLRGARVLADVVPSFQPVPVPDPAVTLGGSHNVTAYLGLGLPVGRSCGLAQEALDIWQRTITTLGGTAALCHSFT